MSALVAGAYALLAAAAAKKPATKIQTLIFDKKVFETAAAAKAWAKKNGFRSGDVDETEASFRLRQAPPGEFKKGSFRTIELRKGVKAVVGRPR